MARAATAKPPATASDEIVSLWLRLYREYAKDNLKIQSQKGDLIPFIHNPIQQTFNDIIDWLHSSGRLVRINVLKARRHGISSDTVGRNIHHTTTKPNRYAFIVTHEPQATDFVFGMAKRMYDHLDESMKPKKKYNNKTILEFNDPAGTGGLDSAIRVGTAGGKENLGSSQLIHYLHLSELAKWQDLTAEALLTSLMQCVPDEQDTEVIAESTANGVGGKFYDNYTTARTKIRVHLDENGNIAWHPEIDVKAEKSNVWVSVFFPWFVSPDYKKSVTQWENESGEKFVRDEEEEKIVALHFKGIPNEIVNQKLCWRRWAIQNKCQGSKKIFQQEYPATDEEAFLGTGRACYDAYQIHALLKAAPKPIMTYEILPHTGDFIAKPDGTGRLWVWKESQRDRFYVQTADVAEGKEVSHVGGDVKYDFSVSDIWDRLTGEQCAQWHGHLDPDLFGRLMYFLGRRYNFAFSAPERNPGGHGSTAINAMMQLGYPRMFVELQPDPPNRPIKKYGWLATESSIGQAVDKSIMEMRENTHGIRSSRTLTEMLAYKRDAKGKYNAEVGRHDDCVRSFIIKALVRNTFPLPAMMPKLPSAMDGPPLPAPLVGAPGGSGGEGPGGGMGGWM